MSSSGDGIKSQNANWRFDEEVAQNFENHIKRSVPFYEEGHNLILQISDYFIKDDSICYELGSSTAKLSFELSKRHSSKKEARFVAIEKEEAMVKKALSLYQNKNLEIIQDDITTHGYQKSDLFISYYTIQFIHPKLRQKLIDEIYNSLEWGGGFIMYEKVRASDARFQDMMTNLYNEYKLSNGYTPEEIINKTKSLKGVLEPFSSKANVDMLKRAGFEDIITIQKYINFEGFLAIK